MAKMKKLLIVAYYFPPSGGPGVQRVLKNVRYLPEFGWEPIVLTVSNGQFPARDESLLEQVPETTTVIRTKIFEPYDIYRMFTGRKKGEAVDVNTIKKEGQKTTFKERVAEFIRATFFIPDARVGWLFSARKKALEIIDKYGVEAVYSSSPPYTCSLIARYAQRKRNIPWIAGFRDPWTGFISTPKRWFLPASIDRRMEHSVFRGADFVECAWQGIIKDALEKYPDLDRSKFKHVPNGYDSNDFPDAVNAENEKFTITYTGSLYGRRNPDSLFKAIKQLIENNKIKPDDFHLRFVGRFGSEVMEMFEKSGFRESIETVSYVPHHESIRYLMKSDALLLIVDESKESEEIVPGKVYEYVGVKRPILAIAPVESAIADLMQETKSGVVAHQSEINKIAKIFYEYYLNWKNKGSGFEPDEKAVNKYERKEAARTLSELLNSLV